VAAQAVNILAGDTKGSGTSANAFQNWYNQNGSVVAGKTGTAVDGGKGTKNSALWFVGMTPSLVATSAVINPSAPSNPIPSLPHVSDPADNAYGDYASQLWLDSFQPTLQSQHWSWPDPNSPAFGPQIPNVIGATLSSAVAQLETAGYHVVQFDPANQTQCASAEPLGTVAFAGPQQAPKGSTITVCVSNGIHQFVYTPPPPPKPTATRGTTINPGGRRTITITRGRPTPPSFPFPTPTRTH
jgi:membrane peptidoglycan carboxypeptidase